MVEGKLYTLLKSVDTLKKEHSEVQHDKEKARTPRERGGDRAGRRHPEGDEETEKRLNTCLPKEGQRAPIYFQRQRERSV